MSFSISAFMSEHAGPSAPQGPSRTGLNVGGVTNLAYHGLRRLWGATLGRRLTDPFDRTQPLCAVPKPLQRQHVENATLFCDRKDMIAKLPKHLVWAEIGTWEGEFARHILDHCEPTELHLFDIDFSRVKANDHISEGDRVRFHQGDSVALMETFPDGHFDVIYIDGDHSLWGVSRDAEVATRKVKPGGYIVFNDYTFFDCTAMYPFGIVPVVNSLCNDLGWKVHSFAFQAKMYCDIVLKKA